MNTKMLLSKPFVIVGIIGAIAVVVLIIWLAVFRDRGYGKDVLHGMYTL